MKVLWISHNIPYPPKTGVLQRNYNLLREASQLGDIYLLAFFQRAVLPIEYDLDEVRRELGRFCAHVEIVDMPVRSRLGWYGLVLRSVFTIDPYTVNWVKSVEMAARIRELVHREKFDIVHFDTIGLAHYLPDVGDVPTVLNHHNIESHLLERRTRIEKNFLKRTYFRMEARKLKAYEVRCARAFKCNVTVSELDRDILREMLPDSDIEVIPNGVDTKYFAPSKAEVRKGKVIFVGGMNWYPNKDAIRYFCKEVWPLLRREVPHVSLTVVGAHPPKELLQLAARDDHVEVTGFVDDVRTALRAAEVYVCPMRDGGGTRLKILDALAMGKAIVSTTMGCEGIDVEPGRTVLLADTARTFVDQIKAVMVDTTLREKLGAEGRKLAEDRYSWNVIGRKLRKIYTQVCDGPG